MNRPVGQGEQIVAKTDARDAARVLVFPPVIPAVTIVLALVLQWLWPLGLLAHLDPQVRVAAGLALVIAGLVTTFGGGRTLARRGTAVRPSQATVALVEDGPFRWTRNPMYVGGTLAMIGAALIVPLDWLPLLLPVSVVFLHLAIVAPEERYLEGKFGDRYRRYKARVPRYLGPF